MLLEFKVSNFRSIAEEQCFSMLPSKAGARTFNTESNFHKEALKVGAIYGANGAGKTNFVKALEFLQNLLRNSGKFNSSDKLKLEQHILSKELRETPTTFDILFTAWGDVWRYFVAINADGYISSEKLTKRNKAPSSKERTIYNRTEKLQHDDLKAYSNVMWQQTNSNQLILSKLDQNNDEVTKKPYDWLVYFLRIIRNLKDFSHNRTLGYLENQSKSNVVLNFLQSSDISVEDIHVKKLEIKDNEEHLGFIKHVMSYEGMPELDVNELTGFDINFLHKTRNNELASINIEDESLGTRNLFALSGPVLDTLKNGFTLVIDELNQSFHTELQKHILDYFIQNETNPNRAQIIFTTHDTNIMNSLERDEIWLCEKQDNGASEYFSLSDFGTVREGGLRRKEAFEKHYLEGRLGGLPDIDHIQSARDTKKWLEKESH